MIELKITTYISLCSFFLRGTPPTFIQSLEFSQILLKGIQDKKSVA